MRTNRKKGFTITELVIVIAVIAVLAAVLIPTFASVVSSANESKAMQNCHNALTTYRASEGGGDVDPGMVLVNNEDDNMYAYVYLGGTLEKLDKLEKLDRFSGDGTKLNEKSDNKITFPTSHTSDKEIEYTIKTPAVNEEGKPKPEPDTQVGTFKLEAVEGEHADMNLYFYTIELNDKTYYGWFTMEPDGDEAQRTLEDGAVIYSGDYGFVEAGGEVTVEFKDAA